MVEVFRTNVDSTARAGELLGTLNRTFPPLRINFDLEDCDHILRVEGAHFVADQIIFEMRKNGCECELLD